MPLLTELILIRSLRSGELESGESLVLRRGWWCLLLDDVKRVPSAEGRPSFEGPGLVALLGV